MILILGLFTIGEISAQDFKRINYQLDFGTTLTIPYKSTIEIWPEIDKHPHTDYSPNFGYFLEVMISYNLNRKYSINTGLNYNYTALGISDKIGLFENKGNLTNSYLTFPVLIKCRLSNKLPISISTGPYLSLLISANEKGTTYIDTAGFIFDDPDPLLESIEPIQKYNTDVKKNYSAIDYGISLQLDYDIKLSQRLNGVVLTRFNYGLKNVLTNDLVNNSSANDWKNYNFMIGFGVKL
ncbi:outer membrane protein with beta-barrel domain [Natronoflexus pectinivorans]|uniref:Outer membrane protein with beta-barrel domain n=2 Tax=Natronoflexus pectinivorans TaxID=682526 RepID=A0A4R2GPA9_9BACT|nr:outer membrane protein with beta-barrel domain [Natronoflexus pectinivorans]